MKAISIRQPWAWLIVNGFKDRENRTWYTKYRGDILIHASKGMTNKEYEYCFNYAHARGVTIPAFTELKRGGFVGIAEITGFSSTTDVSPWFDGPFGWHIKNAKPIDFISGDGKLGIFETFLDHVVTR